MKRIFFTLLIISATGSLGLLALSFDEAVSGIQSVYDVRSAELNVERLRRETAALTRPDDYSVSVSPGIKATSLEEGDFAEEIDFSGTASFRIPLGLSDIEKEKLDFSIKALELAESNLKTVRFTALKKLFTLYQNAWLLQEEERVLALELKAAETYLAILQQQFESGNITFVSLASADEDLKEKRDEYYQNALQQRLAWYELSSYSGIEKEQEKLERFELATEKIPLPGELAEWIEDQHPLIIAEKTKIAQLRQTINRQREPDLDVSIKPFINYGDHSASVTYFFSDPEVTGTYSFPVYTAGEIPSGSGSSTSTWNTGVTLSLSLGSNSSDNLSSEILELDVKSAEARLEYLNETLNLELRSSYQQFLRNQSFLVQAENDLPRVTQNYKIVETKKELGKASDLELIEAESLAARSEWKIESARISTELSWLNLVEDAVWFEKIEFGN